MSNVSKEIYYKVKDGVNLTKYGLSNALKEEKLIHVARYPNHGVPLIQFQIEGTCLSFRVPESVLIVA